MRAKKEKSSSFWRNFLIGAIYGLILIFLWALTRVYGPLVHQEVKYFWNRRRGGEEKLIGERMKATNDLFSVRIPKIQLEAVIVPQVDPGDPDQYQQALRNGVAHAKGSALPGEKGRIYLFAHSTDAPWNISKYNAIFYLLHRLEIDDPIIINYQGQAFPYRVVKKEIVSPQAVNYLYSSEEEDLVLQTCWPP